MRKAYHISEDQFVRANWHAQRGRRGVLVLALYAVLALFPPVMGFASAAITATVVVAVLLAVFWQIVLPGIHRWRYRRLYRQNPLLHKEQRLNILPTGFVLSSDNGESRYQLAELKKVAVLEDMVLVYPTTTLFHIIPVDLLDDFALAQFRGLA
ncbi:YcxB family protein [Litorivivens sp.]|uniref:YcxB family protein n=1 Tax=Litorivivens sp. TaxID=2020868 RepID=UPI003561DA8F